MKKFILFSIFLLSLTACNRTRVTYTVTDQTGQLHKERNHWTFEDSSITMISSNKTTRDTLILNGAWISPTSFRSGDNITVSIRRSDVLLLINNNLLVYQ